MRLLNTTTYTLQTFYDNEIPQYVILSHTWSTNETTFPTILDLSLARQTRGWAKILLCCQQAVRDGFEWAWIDTCCIDKSSSAELSEAINSMFAWYRGSGICYAYLEDVDCECDVWQEEKEGGEGEVVCGKFRGSRWFTRGWTLQELLAPERLEFYSKEWVELGTRTSLKKAVASITGVDEVILGGGQVDVSERSVAERMSWAAERDTTRTEDKAYCLIGLFDVNMPMLYGEGGVKAFVRLQEAIMKRWYDYSLFAWTSPYTRGAEAKEAILANTPAEFCCRGSAYSYGGFVKSREYHGDKLLLDLREDDQWIAPTLTSRGIRFRLAVQRPKSPGLSSKILAYLNTRRISDGYLVCIEFDQSTYKAGSVWERTSTCTLFFIRPDEVLSFALETVIVRGVKEVDNNSRMGLTWMSRLLGSGSNYTCCSFLVDTANDTHITIQDVHPKKDWNPESRTLTARGIFGVVGLLKILVTTYESIEVQMIVVFGYKSMNLELFCGAVLSHEFDGQNGNLEEIFTALEYDHGRFTTTDRFKCLVWPGMELKMAIRKGANKLVDGNMFGIPSENVILKIGYQACNQVRHFESVRKEDTGETMEFEYI